MTRRVDRVHELRRQADEPLFTERRQAVDEVAGADLREVLGIPAGMQLDFGARPVVVTVVVNESRDADRRS